MRELIQLPTTLLSCTSTFMVIWTMNQVALRRMKAVMRFQCIMFLRQRMLLLEKAEDSMLGGLCHFL